MRLNLTLKLKGARCFELSRNKVVDFDLSRSELSKCKFRPVCAFTELVQNMKTHENKIDVYWCEIPNKKRRCIALAIVRFLHLVAKQSPEDFQNVFFEDQMSGTFDFEEQFEAHNVLVSRGPTTTDVTDFQKGESALNLSDYSRCGFLGVQILRWTEDRPSNCSFFYKEFRRQIWQRRQWALTKSRSLLSLLSALASRTKCSETLQHNEERKRFHSVQHSTSCFSFSTQTADLFQNPQS